MEKALQLSIGLIVKNEEKCLERCLLSLQPLLKEIPSELVIVDTGSTDRTCMIAEKYTDKLYHFNWCDDFAKARNYVLDRCNGKWFMQIDADESFESVDEIIEFFKTSECEKYNDASFVVRNYFSHRPNDYKDFYLCRMFKVGEGRRYQGIVHEFVPQVGPVRFFDTHVNHFGYMRDPFFNGTKRKSARNMPLLLKEVEKYPEDTRLQYQLVQEYVNLDQDVKAESVCKKILYREDYRKNDIFMTYAANKLVELNIRKKRFEEAIQNGSYYLELDLGIVPERLDILEKITDILAIQDDYGKAKKYFREYFMLIKFFEQKIEEGETGIRSSSDSFKENILEMKRYQWIQLLEKHEEYQVTLNELMALKGSLGRQRLSDVVDFWIKAIEKTEEYDALYRYSNGIAEEEENKRKFLNEIVMTIWDKNPGIAVKAGGYFADRVSDELGKVQEALIAEVKTGSECGPLLAELCCILPVETYYQRLIYLSLKYDVDIAPYLNRCSISQTVELAEVLYYRNTELRDILIGREDYVRKPESIQELIFYAKLKEFLLFDINLVPEQKRKVLGQYLSLSLRAIKIIFNPSLINLENCKDLPDKVCFIVYFTAAVKYRKQGNLKECLFYMKESVRYNPAMTDIVRLEMMEIGQELEEQRSIDKEFDEYGAKIKLIIKKLIAIQDLSSAREAIDAYEKVNPLDPEIAELKEKSGI